MELVKRICKSYKYSLDEENYDNNSQDSMWVFHIKPIVNDILLDCYNNNILKTYYNLSNPYKNDITYGYDDYFFFKSFKELEHFNQGIKNSLFNLCKSLGLLRVFNPEGGINKDNTMDVEEALIALDKYFGFTIDFPEIFEKEDKYNWVSYVNMNKDLQDAGIITEEAANDHYNNYGKYENRKYNSDLGLYSSRGIIKCRSIQTLHLVSRMKEILKDNIINSTIIEIGAGLGRNAYYAKKLGVKKYIIIDIPATSIMSSYYLGKTLGEENITLYPETSDNYLHILPPNKYTDNLKADLIVQFDGLTEMGIINSEKYINNFTKISPLFLSINHESNNYTVNELYNKNKDISRIYRFLSWYRDGYVEELLQKKSVN
uniref:Sugar O-methyltransferase n=1 Tax=viral metagenome TaxID=1070528 RepID=A0A6C0KS47_9ZZZZ